MIGKSMKENLDTVCIIGLGYVGLTLAVAMANAGYKVRGVERSEHVRKCIENGYAHFSEAGLNEPLAQHVQTEMLTCHEKVQDIGHASIYIITVGTPLSQNGEVNLSSLQEVVSDVAAVIQNDDIVILRSTVKIGITRNFVKPLLDKTNKKYKLAFCPERTLEGKALQEISSLPQVIGGIDKISTERAKEVFSIFSPKTVTVASVESAEMVKLVNNTQRDLMFAFSNEVAEMCDAAGISTMDVIRAACEDYPRSKIYLPGPVGGPCLEKDPHILAEGLREFGYIPKISLAGRKLNEDLPENSIKKVSTFLESIGSKPQTIKKVVILGLAFKGIPETNDLRGTMASHILKAARQTWPGAEYFAYDPIVPMDEFSTFDVSPCPSLDDAFRDANLIIIQNNHKQFSEMNIEKLITLMNKNGLVYDYWNQFNSDELNLPADKYYRGLGTIMLENR